MARIVVKRRLRPIRFAFLVPPDDLTELRRVFQINTVLWGGRHNVVIPAWKRCPKVHRGEASARVLVARFLDAAEPDFVVTGKMDAEEFGVPSDRVVSLDEMLKKPALPEAGVGVMPLYRSLYGKYFQFVARHPRQLVYVKATGRFTAFSAARFGEIPRGGWSFYKKGLHDLGATNSSLTQTAYGGDLLRAWTALALGSDGLDVKVPRRTAYLVIDPISFIDLVDYWNLRAFGWNVLPIPIPWVERMAKVVSEMLDREHKPSRPLRNDVTSGHVMKGRSVASDAFHGFVRSLTAPSDRLVVQTRVPRYWRRDCWDSDHAERPELSAREEDVEVEARDGRIAFPALAPEFDTVHWGSSLAQWANVVQVRSWDLPELAEVFPKGFDEIGVALAKGMRSNSYRCSSEGITVLDSGTGGTLFWKLPDGAAVFDHWLRGRYSVALSTAGRMTRRMIRVLGGPERTRVACSPPIIRLFGSAASSGSRSMRFDGFWGALLKEFRNSTDVAARLLERWVDAGVVDVGFQVVCTECGQKNWYAMNNVSRQLQCQRCLDDYRFPVAHPTKATWAVRPLGPFAVEGRGQGAFTVALAVRLLRLHGSHARTTWVPGLLLRDAGGVETELDFAMLWQEDAPWVRPMRVIFGECKTFGQFEKKDVQRMQALARAFPGAFLVFANLNERLTADEASLIRPLATSGRKHWRNPVVVLTAGELASDWNPPTCWKKGKAAGVAQAIPPLMSLTALADATQQIHLGLGPGEGWPHHRQFEMQNEVVRPS